MIANSIGRIVGGILKLVIRKEDKLIAFHF